jgi:hypothetical protein
VRLTFGTASPAAVRGTSSSGVRRVFVDASAFVFDCFSASAAGREPRAAGRSSPSGAPAVELDMPTDSDDVGRGLSMKVVIIDALQTATAIPA